MLDQYTPGDAVRLWLSDKPRRNLVQQSCLQCGDAFLTRSSQVKRGFGKYCSRSCSGKAGSASNLALHGPMSGDANGMWKGGISKDNSRYNRIAQERRPDVHKAYQITRDAMKTGRLKKQPCQECGQLDEVHAHHNDYSRPLDVVWLCPMHHRIKHGQQHPVQ